MRVTTSCMLLYHRYLNTLCNSHTNCGISVHSTVVCTEKHKHAVVCAASAAAVAAAVIFYCQTECAKHPCVASSALLQSLH
jgi:hypothetical protein